MQPRGRLRGQLQSHSGGVSVPLLRAKRAALLGAACPAASGARVTGQQSCPLPSHAVAPCHASYHIHHIISHTSHHITYITSYHICHAISRHAMSRHARTAPDLQHDDPSYAAPLAAATSVGYGLGGTAGPFLPLPPPSGAAGLFGQRAAAVDADYLPPVGVSDWPAAAQQLPDMGYGGRGMAAAPSQPAAWSPMRQPADALDGGWGDEREARRNPNWARDWP
jgi:hypothetical protein